MSPAARDQFQVWKFLWFTVLCWAIQCLARPVGSIRLSPSSVSLGVLLRHDKVLSSSFSIQIHNDGTEPLHTAAAWEEPPDPFLSIHFSGSPIPPGGSRALRLTYGRTSDGQQSEALSSLLRDRADGTRTGNVFVTLNHTDGTQHRLSAQYSAVQARGKLKVAGGALAFFAAKGGAKQTRLFGLFSQYSVPFVERREKEPNVDAACVPFFQVAWKKHSAGDAIVEIRITFDPQAFFAQTSGRSYAPTDGRSGGEGGGAAGAPFVCSLFVPAELDGARTLHRLPVVVYTGAVHVTAPGVSLVPPFCRAVALPPPPRQRAAKANANAKAAPPAPPWAAMANVSAVCKLCEPTVARAVIAEIGGMCPSPLGAGGEQGGDAAVAAAAEAAEPLHPSATQAGAAQCSDVVADGGVVVVDLGTVAVHSRATAVLKVHNFNPESVTLRGPFRGPRASGMGLLSPEVQFSLTDIQASGVAKAALHLARGTRGLFVHSKGVLIPEISGAFSGGDAPAAAAADDDYYADDYGNEEDAEALSLALPSCAFPAPHATIQHVVNGTAATRRTNDGGAYSAAVLPSEHAADFELAVLATLPSVQQRPCAAAAAAAGAAAAAADLRNCLSHYVVTGLDLFTAGGRVQVRALFRAVDGGVDFWQDGGGGSSSSSSSGAAAPSDEVHMDVGFVFPRMPAHQRQHAMRMYSSLSVATELTFLANEPRGRESAAAAPLPAHITLLPVDTPIIFPAAPAAATAAVATAAAATATAAAAVAAGAAAEGVIVGHAQLNFDCPRSDDVWECAERHLAAQARAQACRQQRRHGATAAACPADLDVPLPSTLRAALALLPRPSFGSSDDGGDSSGDGSGGSSDSGAGSSGSNAGGDGSSSSSDGGDGSGSSSSDGGTGSSNTGGMDGAGDSGSSGSGGDSSSSGSSGSGSSGSGGTEPVSAEEAAALTLVEWAWSDVEIDGLHRISTAVAARVSVTGAVRSSLVVQAQLGWPAFVEGRRLSFGVVRAGQRYTQHLHVVNPFDAPVRVALAAAANEPTKVVNSPYRVTPCARCVTWQTGNSSSGSGGATTELVLPPLGGGYLGPIAFTTPAECPQQQQQQGRGNDTAQGAGAGSAGQQRQQQPQARCGALFTDVYLRSNATRLERVSVVAYVGHGRLSVAQLAQPGDGYRGECADCGVDAGDGGVDLAGSCSCDTTEEMAALHGIGDSVTSSDTDFMITDSRRSWQFDVPPSHLNATVPCACDDDHADAEQRCSSLARDVACSGNSGSGDGDCYDVDGADPVHMCPRTCYKQQHVLDGGSSGAGGGSSAARACHAPRPMAATWSIANMGTVPMRVLDIALALAAPAAANDTEAAAAAAGLARHCEAGGFTITHCDALKAFEPFELAPGESVLAGVTYAPSCMLRAAAAAAPLEPAAELVVLTSDGEHAVTLTPRYIGAGYDVCDELAPLEVLPLPLLPPPLAPADAAEGAEAPWYYTWTFWIRVSVALLPLLLWHGIRCLKDDIREAQEAVTAAAAAAQAAAAAASQALARLTTAQRKQVRQQQQQRQRQLEELHADAALDRRLRRCALVRVYAALRLLQQKRQGLRSAEVQAAADAADRELRRALRWLSCNDTAAAAMSPDEEAAADARAVAEAARAVVHAAEQRVQRLLQEQQMLEQLWAGAVAAQRECARQLRAVQPVVAARWQHAYAVALQGAAAGAAAARGAGAHAAAAAADTYSAASAAAADACAAERLRLMRFGASVRSAFVAVLPAPAARRRLWQLLCTVSRWAMRAADSALLITVLARLYLPRDFASGVFLLKTLLLAVAARALRSARLRGQQRRLPPPWRVLMPVLNTGVNGLLFGFATILAPRQWPVLYTLGLVFAGVNVVASRQQRRRDAREAAVGAAAAQPLAQPPPPLLRRAANSAWELLRGLVTTVLDAAVLIVGWYMVPHLWFTERYNHASKIEFALCLWRRGAAWFALDTNEAAAPAPAPAHSTAAAAAQPPAAAAQPTAAAAQPVAAQSAARAVNDLPQAAAAQPPAAAAHAPQPEQMAAPKALAAAAAPRSRRRGGQPRRGGSKSTAPVVRAAALKGGPAAAPEAALLSKPAASCADAAAAASLLVRQLPSRSTSTSSSTSSDTEYPPAKRAVAGDRTEAPVAGIAGDAAAALMASAAAAAAAPGAAEAQAGAAPTGSAAEVADTAAAALALAAVLGIAAPSLHNGRSGSTAAAAAAAAPLHSPARSAGGQAAAVKGGVSQAELAKEAEEKGVEVAAGAGGGASGSGRRRKRKAAGAQQPQQQPAPAAAAAPKPPAPHHHQQQQVTAPNAPTAPARNGTQRAPAEPAAGAQPRTAPKAAASDAAAKDRRQSKVVAAGGKDAAGGANGSKSGVEAARATAPASAPKAAAAARAAQVASAPKAAAEVRAEAAEGKEGGSSAQVLSGAHASDGGGALEANGSSQAGDVDGGSSSGAVTPTSLLLSLLGKDDEALPSSPPCSGPLRAPPGLEHCRRTPPVAALNKQPPALVHSADTARSTSPDIGDNSSSEPMAAAAAAAAAAVAAAATPVGGTPERAAAAATVPVMSWSRPPLFQLAAEVAGSSTSGDSSSGRHFAVSDTPPVRNPADTAAAAAAAAAAAVPTHQPPDASSGPSHHAMGLMAGVAPPMHGDAALSAAAGALPSVRHGFGTDVLGFGLDAAWGTPLPPERNGSGLAESSPFGAIGSGRHGSDATAAAAAAPAVASSAFVGGGMRSAIAPLAPRGEGGGSPFGAVVGGWGGGSCEAAAAAAATAAAAAPVAGRRTIGAAHVLSMDAGADDDINDILAMTFDVDEAEGDANALPAPAYDRISGSGSSGGGGGGVDGGISRGSSGRSEHMLLSPAMFTDRAALLQSDERSAYSRSSAGAGGGSGGSGGAPPGFSSFLTPSFFASTANESADERAEEGEGGG